MKRENFIYHGLGFPVIIQGVETYTVRGETLPKVNHNRLNAAVFEALLISKSRLTGNQLNFIRGHMNLSQMEFAKRLGFESHATVSAWLKRGNDGSGMSTTTELAIRMLMAHYVNKFDDINQNALMILSEIEDPRVEIEIAA